jgi:hypothetical protein
MRVMAGERIDVFISSTCYDLADLRAVLAHHLRDDGMEVRVSEDPDSAFYVEPTDNSIGSCLLNVEASRLIICIIDRRYGGVLKTGAYAGKSATHAEVLHARNLNKPIFFFVREASWNEFQFLRDNPASESRWVEKDSPEQRRRWVDFISEVSRLPKHENWSNWCDPFKTAVDLRSIVLRRLIQRFPQYAGAKAMDPARFVRLIHYFRGAAERNTTVAFRNIGVGPALKIRHGTCEGMPGIASIHDLSSVELGGLMEGEETGDRVNHGYPYRLPSVSENRGVKVFAEYRNRFGDRYRLEVPLKATGSHYVTVGTEELYVWHDTVSGLNWVLVPDA